MLMWIFFPLLLSVEMALRRMSGRSTTYGLTRNEDSSLETVRGVAPKRGMVLPFTPLAMSFDSVNYFVDMPPVRTYPITHKKINSLYITTKLAKISADIFTDLFPTMLFTSGNEGPRSHRGQTPIAS